MSYIALSNTDTAAAMNFIKLMVSVITLLIVVTSAEKDNICAEDLQSPTNLCIIYDYVHCPPPRKEILLMHIPLLSS